MFYVNTGEIENIAEYLRKFSIEEKGFDDVMIFAPNKDMVSYGTEMLAYDGCLNSLPDLRTKHFLQRLIFMMFIIMLHILLEAAVAIQKI